MLKEIGEIARRDIERFLVTRCSWICTSRSALDGGETRNGSSVSGTGDEYGEGMSYEVCTGDGASHCVAGFWQGSWVNPGARTDSFAGLREAGGIHRAGWQGSRSRDATRTCTRPD